MSAGASRQSPTTASDLFMCHATDQNSRTVDGSFAADGPWMFNVFGSRLHMFHVSVKETFV